MNLTSSHPSDALASPSSRGLEGHSRPSPLGPELREELASIAAAEGCEVLHVEKEGRILRIFLDREGEGEEGPVSGVTLAHCEAVSRQLSAVMDVSDEAVGGRSAGSFVLEVSSPGLDRQLYGPRDYQRFQGRAVRVTYFGGEPRHKQTIVGRLDSFDPDVEQIVVVVGEAGATSHREGPHRISLRDVEKARLEIEL